MKITPSVIKELNETIGIVLVGINQSFLHARMLKHFGYDDLGSHLYKRSIKFMKDADILVNRIFLLEGLPNLQKLGKLSIGQSLHEILELDLKLENFLHKLLINNIELCEKEQDYASRKILDEQLKSNEEYIDWLGTQLSLIEEIGLVNYMQSAI